MGKIFCLLLVILIVAGIIVYRRAPIRPADSRTENGVPAPQNSKAEAGERGGLRALLHPRNPP